MIELTKKEGCGLGLVVSGNCHCYIILFLLKVGLRFLGLVHNVRFILIATVIYILLIMGYIGVADVVTVAV